MGTILVVDDDLLFHRIISLMLRRGNYNVITASSAKQAMAKLATESVDMVFVDLAIPEVSGMSLLEQLRADERYVGLPVVILTASAMWDDRIDALNRGATAYLQKPASSWELAETVNRLLPEAVPVT